MGNDALHTFIQVIEAGSFTKAAEKLYLSPTALMKQMNALEAQIGVPLFIRTHHGIRATEAGTSFYHDARFLLQYSEKVIARAQQVANKNPYCIRIGTSMLNPCTALINVWNTISDAYPQFKLKMVPFADDVASWPTVYRTIGKDIDVMVGTYERGANESGSFQALKLGEYRVSVAVSRQHPLARKERLSVTDLYGERLVLIQPGTSPLVDTIRDYLGTEHPTIQMTDTLPQYTIDVFNRCEAGCAVLLTLDGWKDVHPSLVTLPVDWPYTMPYGILYPRKPSNSVQLFVRALQEAACSNSLTNHR